jgi:nitroreductase
MDFAKLVNDRYSVRSFSNKPVEKEKIEAIIDAARKAPSAVNFQPYTIFVVSQPENLQKIGKCYHRSWLASAPVLMVVVGNKDMAWKRASDMKNYTDIDCAILIDHITLQATDLGLGTCWICNFDIDLLNETLALKPQQEAIAIIPVGYPESDEIPAKKRKGIDDLVVWM